MLMKNFKSLLEQSAFGVCDKLAEKLGIATTRVRLYFIYLSFFTFGSPVIIYFFMAFMINIREYIKKGRHLLWN